MDGKSSWPLPQPLSNNGAEFAENPEPRYPCILLLDTSWSMKGQPIAQLNEGLVTFKDDLAADALPAKISFFREAQTTTAGEMLNSL